MSSILLSVKPEYAERIFEGKKLYEYRKRLPQKTIKKILVYATNPIMRIIGEVEVIGIISGTPTFVWEQTKRNAGISRAKYREYFKGHRMAYAYRIGQTIIYDTPKRLDEIGILYPPQSFIYIGKVGKE